MTRFIALLLLFISVSAYAQSPVTVIGPITVGNCAQFSSTTIIKDAGIVCGGGGTGGIVIGTTTVTGAGAGQFLFNNSGVVGAATLGTMSTQNANAVAITGGTITGLPSPTLAADAANKSYVDSVAVGLTIHTQVAWATTGVLPNTPTYANGTAGVGATLTASGNAAIVVDGGSPILNDRVLVKNQASALQNGVYVVSTVGSGSVPWVLTRTTDFNTAIAGNMAEGAYFFVYTGATNIGSSWVFITPPTITIGTTALAFVQYANSGSSPWLVSGANVYYNAGNVGIGTSTPVYSLTVHAGVNQNFGVTSASGITSIISFDDANSVKEPLRILSTTFNLVQSPLSIGGTVQYITPQLYDSGCGTAGHDCTAAFNTFLLTVSGGVKGYMPCGTYDISSTAGAGASNSFYLEGAGYCSFIRATANVNALNFGDFAGSAEFQHAVIKNLRFGNDTSSGRTNAMLAGIGLLNDVTFENLWIDTNVYMGVYLQGIGSSSLNLIVIKNVQVLNCALTGITMLASGPSAQEGLDRDTAIIGCAANGVLIGGGLGGVLLDNLAILNDVGLNVTAQSGSPNREFFLGQNFDTDTNAHFGALFNGGAVAGGGTIVFKGWAAGTTSGPGLYIGNQGGLSQQVINGGVFYANNQQGMVNLDVGGNVSVTGNSFNANGSGNLYAAGHACAGNVGSNVSGGC